MQENARELVLELTNGERPLDVEMWSHSSTAESTQAQSTPPRWTPRPTTRSSLTSRASRSLTRQRRSPWTLGGFTFPHFPPTDTTQRWRHSLPRPLTRSRRRGETNRSVKTDEEDGEKSRKRSGKERTVSLVGLISVVFEVTQLRKSLAGALERD